jgi:dipeptidase D
MTFVSQLSPPDFWQYFDDLLAIPRASAHEEQARQWVKAKADSRSLRSAQDAAGNLVVYLPATPGCEGAPTAILQAHLDMVTEKHSDLAHDFLADPLIPRREGDLLLASGTTLGADNGIGVAAMVALMMTREVKHGPLELLFTVEEETGLYGALNLDPGLLRGRLLLNLDSEDEGTVTVGCAGGAGCELLLPLQRTPLTDERLFHLHLSGGRGGHSGIDIHLGRLNAIAALARCLRTAQAQVPLRLVQLVGGDKTNAIPREAQALVAIPPGNEDQLRRVLEADFTGIEREFRVQEPKLRLAVTPTTPVAEALDAPSTSQLLALLVALPHGVQAMSPELPGLVETSSTLAVTAPLEGGQRLHVSCRSSVEPALRALQACVEAVAQLAGASCEIREGYPGWQPSLHSPLLGVLQQVHQELFAKPAKVCALHAGLECGLLARKLPELDAISIGPTMHFPHSPDESVSIPSVARFYQLLKALVARLGSS